MRAAIWLVVCGVLGACGTDESAGVEPPLEPAPPEGGQQLATSTYVLEPGEEKYICYQFYSPDAEVGITRVEQISAPGVHHFALFQAFGRNEPDEPHECNTIIKQTWLPIWVSGTGSHELTLPESTGFIIAPATQYIVQLHLQNTGDETMKIRTGVNLTYEHDTSSVIPAGMFGIGTFDVEIPAQTTDFSLPTVSCNAGKDMNVFGVFPHMHKLGSRIELKHAAEGATPQSMYKVDPWRFGDAPFDPLTKTVTPTDHFELTCTYANPGSTAVTFGESSDNEMCFFVLFYYPYDHLDGCIVGG